MSLGILENGTVLPFVANEIRIYKITIKKGYGRHKESFINVYA
jgi:hypothetical protein